MTIVSVLLRWGLLALGLALAVVGIVVASQPTPYGWFGSPDGAFIQLPSPLMVLLAGAAAALAAGIALVSGWAGYRLGRRSSGSDGAS